jgi:glycerate kinase
MSSLVAAEAMRTGIRRFSTDIEVDCIPVADGGDGLVEVLAGALAGEIISVRVCGPLQDEVEAIFCHVPQTDLAIIEMAQASGLALVGEGERNPEKTSTLGTGQLIAYCLDLKVKKLIVGLGGSATCDGGIGAATAVGYRFVDNQGRLLDPIGANLGRIASIVTDTVDRRIDSVVFETVCDVVNPLTGPNGASFVYSPQKGADADQVKRLDDGLRHLASIVRRDLGIDIENLAGAGAAGGLGGGLCAFFGAELKRGAELVLDLVGLAEKVKGADPVLIGEGQMDFQTKFDKAPAAVARIAREAGVPCVAICGQKGANISDLHSLGIDAVFTLCDGPMTLDRAVKNGQSLLTDASEQVIRLCSRFGKTLSNM